MRQARLFDDPTPPTQAGIDLRCCDVAELLAEVRGADLVHADPPWVYRSGGVFRGWEEGQAGRVEDHYGVLTDTDIADHIAAAYECAADDAYLLLWCTWPKLGEWMAQDCGRWAYKTGGSWHKLGRIGVGFHVRGDSEPWLIYVKGKPRPLGTLSNAWSSYRQAHSEKPDRPLADAVASFCGSGGLVFDLYAGLGPAARACLSVGASYIGAEIDPERHRAALSRLALQGAV